MAVSGLRRILWESARRSNLTVRAPNSLSTQLSPNDDMIGGLFFAASIVFVGQGETSIVVGIDLSTVRHFRWQGLRVGCEVPSWAENDGGRDDLVDVESADQLERWVRRLGSELPERAAELHAKEGEALLERTREVRARASAVMSTLPDAGSLEEASELAGFDGSDSALADAVLSRSFAHGIAFHPTVVPFARMSLAALVRQEREVMVRLATMTEPAGRIESPSDRTALQLLPSTTDLAMRRWPKSWVDPIPDWVG